MSKNEASLGRLQFASHTSRAAVTAVWTPGLCRNQSAPPRLTLLSWAGSQEWGLLTFVILFLSSPFLEAHWHELQQYQPQMWLWKLGSRESPAPGFHGGLQTPRDFLWANPGCCTRKCSCGLSSSPRFAFDTKQSEDKKITCRHIAVKQKSKLLLQKCNSYDRGTKTWAQSAWRQIFLQDAAAVQTMTQLRRS